MAEKTTIGAYLMYKDTTFKKLIPITDYPNMGSEPESIDISTMDSKFRKYAQGMIGTDDFTFTAIADETAKGVIDGLADTETIFALFFDEPDLASPTGADGKYYWKGTVSYTEQGASVNSARTASIKFYLTSAITTTEPSA